MIKKTITHLGNMTETNFHAKDYVEKKPKERLFHANGSGFYGTFTVTNDITQYTRSLVFSEINKKSEVLIRFSSTVSEFGTPELLRDNRGFAIKFLNQEEPFDILGLNTPVQWVSLRKDVLSLHDSKRDIFKGFMDSDRRWNFFSNTPSTLHILTMIYSDRGIPKNWSHMNGYGVNTFSFINKNNERVWVKFHFKTQQGHEFLTDLEAADIMFDQPNYMTTEMNRSINNGIYPKWKMYVQVMSQESAINETFNPFQDTNVWPHKKYPMIEVGVIELNKIAENQLEEIEIQTFGPGNLPDGVGLSPDIALVDRAYIYPIMQKMRLNKNIKKLSKNILNDIKEFEYTDLYIKCYNKETNDYYSQPRALWNLFSQEEKQRLYKNLARPLSKINKDILERQLNLFKQIDPDYSSGVTKEIGLIKID